MDKNIIYRIVNFLDGKSYIGMTRRGLRRKTEHFHQLEIDKHHNAHLQNAYNKYGKQSFYFEILEDNILDSEVHDREIYWIKQFKETHYLYNITDGGDAGGLVSVVTVWNGIEYPSMAACSEESGICMPTLRKYLDAGYQCEDDIPPHSRHRVTIWDGIEYENIMAASKSTGIHYSMLTRHINQGHDSSDQISYNRRKITIWNGVEYPSVRSAANAANVNVNSMLAYLDRGFASDQEVNNYYAKRPQSNPISLVIDGVEYHSMAAARKATGFPNSRLKKISEEQRGRFKVKLQRTAEYECAYCHKKWIGKKSDKSKYCSMACMGKARNTRVEITCEVCGKKRVVKIGQQDAKYCSQKCYRKATKQDNQNICQNCGISFHAVPSAHKFGRGKFCSIKCRTEGSQNKVQRFCEVCGKSFLAVPSKVKIGSAKYCSYACMGKARTGKPRNVRLD